MTMANLLEIHNKIMKNFENYQDKCEAKDDYIQYSDDIECK